MLSGCKSDSDLNRMIEIRQSLLGSNVCSFDLEVAADYVDSLFEFSMRCQADSTGTVNFEITSPETLAGVSGKIEAEKGQIIFDDTVVVFDLLTDGLATPISAPWLLIHTLRGGYINAAGADGELCLFQIDDSYAEETLRLDIWIDQTDVPVAADILWNGRRIVALTIKNFRFV